MLSELIKSLDKNIFHFVNSALKNRAFDLAFPVITRLGEDLLIIALGVLLFFLGRKKEKAVSVIILVTLFFSRLSVLVLKRLTHKPRPFLIYENVHLIGKPIFSSFPSGHTTLATAICVVLCFKYKRLSPLFIFLAFLVGVSRLYVGQHYPTDVMAGFVLGSGVALAVLYLEKLIQKNKPRSAA